MIALPASKRVADRFVLRSCCLIIKCNPGLGVVVFHFKSFLLTIFRIFLILIFICFCNWNGFELLEFPGEEVFGVLWDMF